MEVCFPLPQLCRGSWSPGQWADLLPEFRGPGSFCLVLSITNNELSQLYLRVTISGKNVRLKGKK